MNFFEVYYKDEEGKVIETLKVKRVKRNKHQDLFTLIREPLYLFFKYNYGVGSMFSENPTAWKDLEKAAKLLPVVGQDSPGFDLNKLEDDYDQIIRIFFTTSRIENGILEDEVRPQPSLVAQLHYIDYAGEILKLSKRYQEETPTVTPDVTEGKV